MKNDPVSKLTNIDRIQLHIFNEFFRIIACGISLIATSFIETL